MRKMLTRLGSGRLAVVLLAGLGVVVLITHVRQETSQWWLVGLFALLAANLTAALLTHPTLRRGGLLVFHLALLVLMGLAGVGQLTRFQGRVEITEGNPFSESAVDVVTRGSLHPEWLASVDFVQGPFRVEYAPGLKRGRTSSLVTLKSGDTALVGDDEPLVASTYRFYTTHNKGFAPVLRWQPDRGSAVIGAVHMPSYPLFDWKQDNHWEVPAGPRLRFWLHLDLPRDDERGWVLDSKAARGTLILDVEGRRLELKLGQSLRLQGGNLEFAELRAWMGYKIYFDPTLPYLLLVAVIGLLGLGWHLWYPLGRSVSTELKQNHGQSAGALT